MERNIKYINKKPALYLIILQGRFFIWLRDGRSNPFLYYKLYKKYIKSTTVRKIEKIREKESDKE
jgi:hypothetical protein